MGHDKGTVLSELPIEKKEAEEGGLPQGESGLPEQEVVPKEVESVPKDTSPLEQDSFFDFLKAYMNKILVYMGIFVLLNTDMVRNQLTDLPFTMLLGENIQGLVVSLILAFVGAMLWFGFSSRVN